MQRLSSSDIERVRMFLDETAVPCDLANFTSVLLPAVQRLVPSVFACYAQVDPVQGKLIAQEIHPQPGDVAKNDGTFERYMFEHPVFEQWGRTGTTSALRRSDLLTRREWHRRGVYRNVYKQWGCEDSMPIGLPAPKSLLACICSERDMDFTDTELQIMELIRPHVAQMYRNAELFSLLGQTSPSTGARSIVLDKSGRPLLATLRMPGICWRRTSGTFRRASGNS